MAYKIDVKKVAKLQYTEVGKDVIAATVGGALAGYAHFMFLAPQFPGQYYGVNTASIIDWIVAGGIAVATALYAKKPLPMLLGFGAAGTLATIGILQQFGIIPAAAPVIRVARVTTPVRTNITTPVRTTAVGSYQLTA